MRVLIVEDEALIAMHLEMLVMEHGHRVCAVVGSAGEAVKHAAEHHPDVILMDIRLAGGTSGIDAARVIHTEQGIRCIFVSGNLDEAIRKAARPYNPIAFVGKPILPIKIKQALESAERAIDI